MDKLYRCDPEKNIECTKAQCFVNGGICENTKNDKYEIKIKQVPSGLTVNNGIELMNINLKGITLDKEIKKLEEEYGEFMNVINGEDEDTSFYHAVEELFDIVQAALGVIFLKYKKKASAVMRLYQYHEIKIQNRPRRIKKERGI
ncbi:nucleoside triphosphate pyrophosphohydrolase family protein [Clostridium butyricum]|uniref:hypothetical protein n=1 Tax=Clostridium butyricum TaxID=1492 RepID=UPI002AB2C93F|nr:hypothetical protein [Clostridium butyricum]